MKMGSSSMRLFAIASILMMLFMSTEMGTLMVVEARTCESPSHRFHGVCVRGSNCGAVCNTEGFPGGSCRDSADVASATNLVSRRRKLLHFNFKK